MSSRVEEKVVSVMSEAIEYDHSRIDVSSDRTTCTLKAGGTSVALGDPVFVSGKHSWECVIEESFHSWGDGMLIGVTDATGTTGEAWGLFPLTGHVHICATTDQCGKRGKQVCEPLNGYAKGSRIRVTVDLERRTLAFSIGGKPDVEAGIQLPPQVRPWILMSFQGDSISVGSGKPTVGVERGAVSSESMRRPQCIIHRSDSGARYALPS
ncbi:hypothetical protein AB1Y20_005334 [Prymnesium parvum]|uniref:B30.2/SPRY domain-containing protein n=1 Tax=Prymnesium parvum TaxID=97485 RepID=A0AB34J677_PRYPA